MVSPSLNKPSVHPAVAAGLLLLAFAEARRATVITAAPVDFTVAEATLFAGAVATFTDDDPLANAGNFTATIDWGDGSPVTAGRSAPATPSSSSSTQHTYADEGPTR